MKRPAPATNRIPSIIVAVVIAAVATLSIYYLVRGQPLLVQGEVDATRFDIAARVDGRVAAYPDPERIKDNVQNINVYEEEDGTHIFSAGEWEEFRNTYTGTYTVEGYIKEHPRFSKKG